MPSFGTEDRCTKCNCASTIALVSIVSIIVPYKKHGKALVKGAEEHEISWRSFGRHGRV
jgi:hypothetical protein